MTSGARAEDPHDRFPKGFFSRADETTDAVFYVPDRFVTHIDDAAIAAVSALYTELGLTGNVLDLMSSWISHFPQRPENLVVLGMNRRELLANEMAHEVVVHDLNTDPSLPFADSIFDGVTCCVSVDYLVRPIDVLAESGRVARPGAPIVCTFSNRCFPTKAIRVGSRSTNAHRWWRSGRAQWSCGHDDPSADGVGGVGRPSLALPPPGVVRWSSGVLEEVALAGEACLVGGFVGVDPVEAGSEVVEPFGRPRR